MNIMKNMQKIFIITLLIIGMSPILAKADAGHDDGLIMMQQVENSVLGDETFDEMESLMETMMQGEMSDSEIDRMAQVMKENPAAHSMMMNRMMHNGENKDSLRGGVGHMSQSYSANLYGSHWLMFIIMIIWGVVGILAIRWFIKK